MKIKLLALLLLSGCSAPGVITGRVDFYNPADYQGQNVIIKDSGGGRMTHYYNFYDWMLYSGSTIEIQGSCESSCALVLQSKMLPRICAHHDAVFKFHAARHCKIGTDCSDLKILKKDTEIFYNSLDSRVQRLLPPPEQWTLDYISIKAEDLSKIGVLKICA